MLFLVGQNSIGFTTLVYGGDLKTDVFAFNEDKISRSTEAKN